MRYVKYIGLAHERQITAFDWARAGIKGAATVVWNAGNGFHVSADQLTDEQIRKAIDPDSNFVIVGTDDEPATFEGQNMTPGEVDQAVTEPVDINGAVSGTDADAQSGSGALGAPGGTPPTVRGTASGGSGHDTPSKA